MDRSVVRNLYKVQVQSQLSAITEQPVLSFYARVPVKDCYQNTNTSCDGMWRCFQSVHKLDGYGCKNTLSGRYVRLLLATSYI